MRLTRIELSNFRNHESSVLELKDATFICIRGKNFAGKSSIGQAISMGLTPSTEGLNAKGDGFTKKIKLGANKAVITLDVQGKQHLVRQIVTLNTNTSGRTQKAECIDDPEWHPLPFENNLKSNRDAFIIALNTEAFLSMDEKDQKSLLAKSALPQRYDFPQDKVEAVEKLIGAGFVDFDAEPFLVIEKAHKKLYDERAVANRQVKDFVIPEALPKPKDVDSASLQKEVEDARAQRTKLQKERDEAVAKANEIEVRRGRLQTKIEGLRSDVEKGKKRLTELEATVLNAEQIKGFTATVAKKAELDALNQQHAAYLGGIRTVNQQIDKLRGIEEQGATCPVCDQDIDSGKITTLIADLKKESADADAKLQELDKKIEAIGDIHAAQEALKKHEAAVKEKESIEKSLTETVKTGKATKAELEALPAAVNATLNFNDPLAEIEAKITSIMEKLGPVAAAEERAKDIAAKTETLTKLQAKAAKLDALVKYFDKDGVKAELIGQYVGSFENKINSVLDAFGYKTSLTMEPFNFQTTTARGYSGPVREISKAERQLFYPAFQCAVSIAAGINMVVVDDMDTYLKETGLRNEMYGRLYKLVADGSLEQVIVIEASVDNTVPPKDKRAPGSKYFFVEDGTVVELR